MSTEMSFGEYLRNKREALGKSLRGFAADLDIGPAYLSDIEKGNRNPPQKHLEKIIKLLGISGEEVNKFYDLVGEENQGVSPDLSDYICKTEKARIALRIARDKHTTDEQWQEIIKQLENR
jgi:transcriptional regulator with XRE-family HTH domain